MFQKILVALDKSEVSNQVFQAALDLAKSDHASLLLLHVLSFEEEDYPIVVGHTSLNYNSEGMDSAIKQFDQQWQAYEHQGIEMLKSRTTTATAAGVPTEYIQCLGGPGACICANAREWGADLVVIGRRRLSILRELVLGSVSNYVIHHAPCNVLTVQSIVQKNVHAEPLQATELSP
ncbi:universal stress protein [Leptolyngbya sp. AN03gr2]|uniref:universal stress protein n=1 Tax=unclassified Leptolyngbya TaxID=2650499 RepID=UPI003D31AB89